MPWGLPFRSKPEVEPKWRVMLGPEPMNDLQDLVDAVDAFLEHGTTGSRERMGEAVVALKQSLPHVLPLSRKVRRTR